MRHRSVAIHFNVMDFFVFTFSFLIVIVESIVPPLKLLHKSSFWPPFHLHANKKESAHVFLEWSSTHLSIGSASETWIRDGKKDYILYTIQKYTGAGMLSIGSQTWSKVDNADRKKFRISQPPLFNILSEKSWSAVFRLIPLVCNSVTFHSVQLGTVPFSSFKAGFKHNFSYPFILVKIRMT